MEDTLAYLDTLSIMEREELRLEDDAMVVVPEELLPPVSADSEINSDRDGDNNNNNDSESEPN